MSVSRKKQTGNRRGEGKRRFTIRGVHRSPVDIGKLGRALLGLAQAEAERQARAEHTARSHNNGNEPEVTAEEQRSPQGGAE